MPLWVLLEIKTNGKIGAWKEATPFPYGTPRYEFPGSSIEGKSVPQALRNLAKQIEVENREKGSKG